MRLWNKTPEAIAAIIHRGMASYIDAVLPRSTGFYGSLLKEKFMRTTRGFVAAMLLLLTIVTPLQAQQQQNSSDNSASSVSSRRAAIDAEKEKGIRRMIELEGFLKAVQDAAHEMLGQVQASEPDMPKSFWEKARKNINTEELLPQLIPIYDRLYTKEEIDSLIAFYQTPLGQKMLRNTIAIQTETAMPMQEWAMNKIRDLAVDVEMERPVKKPQSPPKPKPQPTKKSQPKKKPQR